MKIENAIILAAGRGSRMKNLTNTKPKCRLKINNKTIIQRTIDAFKYNNINNIVVITGYKSSILQKHLATIDKNIKTIYNPLWETTNSITSMLLALDYLHNSIVIDSDIYINDLDMIRNDVPYSGYSAVINSNTNEWQLETDDSRFIKSVYTSGSYDNALPIIDISYWLKDDSKIISDKIKMMSKSGKEEDSNRFWDEVPLFECLNQLKLRRYDIEKFDAFEMDTPEELARVRKLCSAD